MMYEIQAKKFFAAGTRVLRSVSCPSGIADGTQYVWSTVTTQHYLADAVRDARATDGSRIIRKTRKGFDLYFRDGKTL
jgi:hypothetical protein